MSDKTREDRYAEAITEAEHDPRWAPLTYSDPMAARRLIAAAVMAVADAELAAARAEAAQAQSAYSITVDAFIAVRDERDKAREECGHEKAMRAHLAGELSVWIRRSNDRETERDDAWARLARVERLCEEYEAATVGVNGPDARFARFATREIRAALAPQIASPAADGEHVHVCVTCAATWDGEKWVTA